MSASDLPRYLDELTDEHVGSSGNYSEALSDLVIQSEGPPPAWVDPSWVRRADILWRARPWPIHRPRRLYVYADPEPIEPEVWAQHIKAARMRPERRAVALALAIYADHGTGRNVRPAVETLAKGIGRGRSNVNRHIRGLLRDDWLTVTGKAARGVIVYALTLPKAAHNLVTK
jgi:hypothetical protein